MEVFIVIVIIILAYSIFDFYVGSREDALERRKEDEKYSFKKISESINKK